MTDKTEEKPQDSGKKVERNNKGQFVEGHEKLGGREEGSVSFTSIIKKYLKELSPDGKRQAIEVLATNVIQDALDGDGNKVKLIWNYLDGLPKQSLELEGKGELPFLIKIVKGDDGTTTTEGEDS